MITLDVTNPLAQTSNAPEPGTARDPRVNANTFLQLLVAQIRTQNPLDPQKGTEFVTQLAQFSTLEQLIGIRDELVAIRQAAASNTHSNHS